MLIHGFLKVSETPEKKERSNARLLFCINKLFPILPCTLHCPVNYRFPFMADSTHRKRSDINNPLSEFRNNRIRMNEKIMNLDHLGIKRFFNLDTNTYRDGALPSETKELLALTASAVLRCNDCIDYHLEQCAKSGFSKDEIIDALNVALVVGGSIVIPHLRHAVATLEILEEDGTLTESNSKSTSR